MRGGGGRGWGGGVKHVNAYSITVSLSQVIDRDPGLAVSPVWLSPQSSSS